MTHMIIKKRGFTLVETLFYIAGAVLLLVVVTTFFFYMYEWYRQTTVAPRVDRVGTSLVDTLARSIRGGATVNTTQSSFGTTLGSLSVTGRINLIDITKRFSISEGRVLYEETSITNAYLSPTGMTVSRLYFTQATTSLSSAVKFDVDISYLTKTGTTTKTYSGFTLLKQSYE